jgi:hypothetical protein
MNEFYNYTNLNDIDETDKLDKLAREINEKKNKEKNKLIRQVNNDFKNDEKKWNKDLQKALKNNDYISSDYDNNNELYSKYINNKSDESKSDESKSDESKSDESKSLKSDELKSDELKSDESKLLKSKNMLSNYPIDMSTLSTLSTDGFSLSENTYQNSFFNSSNYNTKSKLNSNLNSNSLKNLSYIDTISIDSYIDEIKNKNKTLQSHKLSKLIKSLDYDTCSKNDDNIYDHVKKCLKCKKKLLDFLNGNLNSKNNIIKNKDNLKKFLNKKNIKESIIMILLGIFIIILLDSIINIK